MGSATRSGVLRKRRTRDSLGAASQACRDSEPFEKLVRLIESMRARLPVRLAVRWGEVACLLVRGFERGRRRLRACVAGEQRDE